MRFDFDPKKDVLNRQRHGIGLDEAGRIWDSAHVIIPAKNVKGESRYAILGNIKNKVYVAIYTLRDEGIRIISCHRADKRWERLFYDFTKKSKE